MAVMWGSSSAMGGSRGSGHVGSTEKRRRPVVGWPAVRRAAASEESGPRWAAAQFSSPCAAATAVATAPCLHSHPLNSSSDRARARAARRSLLLGCASAPLPALCSAPPPTADARRASGGTSQAQGLVLRRPPPPAASAAACSVAAPPPSADPRPPQGPLQGQQQPCSRTLRWSPLP